MDDLEGQLPPSNQCWMYFPSSRDITVLQDDAQAIRSYPCLTPCVVASGTHLPIFSGFAFLAVSRLASLAKGLGAETCDFSFCLFFFLFVIVKACKVTDLRSTE